MILEATREQEVLAALRAEQRALEAKIDLEQFDLHLSRQLDTVVVEIEAVESEANPRVLLDLER